MRICFPAAAAATLALLVSMSGGLDAQSRPTVGPAKCVDCHDHRDEKEWWQTRDGDGKGRQHSKADRRLEDAKAAEFAKALGVKDVYDPRGACVSCHATVVSGSADFGVSCESCHGAGRDYLTPHQAKGSYQAAVALGMSDIKEKPTAWARMCIGCHVMGARPGEAALIAAGHPNGLDFDLAAKYPAVALHFTTKYPPAQIASAAAALRSASRLPEAPPIAATAVKERAIEATSTTAAVVPIPVRLDPPPLPRAPFSPPTRVVVTAKPAAVETRTAAAPATALQRAADLQGRLVVLLAGLLASGTQHAVPRPAPRQVTYLGADAELMRLQDEVIRLAVEALAFPPRGANR